MIKEYAKIRLTTGEIARILEIFKDGGYIAEIFRKKGGLETTEIRQSDIASVFVENEIPLRYENNKLTAVYG
ncbi:MAG: hypothetical protein LBM98_02190 [Oscillospiraceae bacterium]|jgi:hypothetical protein|nr:hypothetical protein [Oscillospiraceae bacterium]